MKPSTLVAFLTLALVPSLAAFGAPDVDAAAPAPVQDSEFRTKYRQAMKINAVEEMGRLIRRNDHEAVLWIIETCESIAERSNEELEERIAGLRAGWEAGMETQFVDKVYTYVSLLDPQIKRERQLLRARYDKARDRYLANVPAKDGPTFGILAVEFQGLATSFATLGDHYFSSQSWLFYGICHNVDNRGDSANNYEACAGYKAALDARDALELKDRTYNDTRLSYTHLSAQGFGSRPGEKPDTDPGGAPEAEVSEAGSALAVAMKFELIDELDAVERPNYHADDFYQIWDALSFTERGTNATFGKLDKLSPTALRRGDADVIVTVDGPSGKQEVEIPMTGNLEPVQFEIGTGDERRTWAALTALGQQTDTYQGLQLNLAPSTGFLSVFWLNAGSMVGSVNGTRVQVLDDNVDGIYGSLPRTWRNVGLSEGYDQPELDSIVVGAEKRARPWSDLQKIGDAWYKLEVQRGGNALACTPVEVETGFLALDYSGPVKPTWLVVQGTGRNETSYFDIAGAKGKGAEVPVGRYSLFYGELRKGRRAQTAKTLILPGRSSPRYDVTAGEVTKVSLGAPYSFDYSFKTSEAGLVVPGKSVVVIGSAGERYERPWNAVASPSVSWREAGSKRGSKVTDMPVLRDTDPMYSEGYHVAWFPRDLTLPLPSGVGKIEVQLTEKKHKLFGKIESGWKE